VIETISVHIWRDNSVAAMKEEEAGLLLFFAAMILLTYRRCFGAPARRVFPDHLITADW
jgi:hypothetical protein